MTLSLRSIQILTQEQAQQELEKIHCQPQGLQIMLHKYLFKTIKIEQIRAKEANLLKQTFLSKGGEVAISRGCADLSTEYTDVIIGATVKQYHTALAQLKSQPWGLPGIAVAIEQVLYNEMRKIFRTYPYRKGTWTIESGRTLVMGILNVTPDSFSDGGKYNQLDAAFIHLKEMIAAGADIIDIGAESTRPYGSQVVSAEEETNRLLPILKELVKECPVPISVDTYKASVAQAAICAGADIMNDIWGLQKDPQMAEIAAATKKPVVIMHNQDSCEYQGDIVGRIVDFLAESIEMGMKAGIDFSQFIIDPGIGFGKTTRQNLEVMSRLEELKSLGCPILLGTSRKRFIGEVLNLPVEDRVEGTAATVAVGIVKGAHIVRVHDVKPISRIAKMTDAMLR